MATFLYCFPFSYRSSNLRYQKLSLFQLAIPKVVALNLLFNFCISFVDGFMASFLYCFPYSYRSSNYCKSNSCRSFALLKALAKSNSNLFAIAFKSYRDSWKSDNSRERAVNKETKN